MIVAIIITAVIFFFLRSKEKYYDERALRSGKVKDIHKANDYEVWKVFVIILLFIEVVCWLLYSTFE